MKHIKGSLEFFGPAAYGVSHEIEHLKGGETERIPFCDFEYILGRWAIVYFQVENKYYENRR